MDEALEGLENQAGDDDGEDQAPLAQALTLQVSVDGFGGEGDKAKVGAHQGGGGERVGDAPLEDEVDIHQAVADDRPAEGPAGKG